MAPVGGARPDGGTGSVSTSTATRHQGSRILFGYAGALKADVLVPRVCAGGRTACGRGAGIRAARRVCRESGATIMHGHWVVPGGFMGLVAAGPTVPLVVSLHGSDVYVAARHALAGRAARRVFDAAAWVTACSADLRDRAIGLGAAHDRSEVLPYGVDTTRFAPDAAARRTLRLGSRCPRTHRSSSRPGVSCARRVSST